MILEQLVFHADDRPESPAISIEDATASFADLATLTRDSARRLAEIAGSGEVWALAGPTSIELIANVFALQWLGAIPLVIDGSLPPHRITTQLHQLSVAGFLAHGPVNVSLGAIPVHHHDFGAAASTTAADLGPPRCAPDDIAYLQLTSGTSGDPQASAISHGALAVHLETLEEGFSLAPADVGVNWMPLHHDFGLVYFVFAALWVGFPVHHLQPRLTNLGRWLTLIERVNGTVTGAPDFAYRAALKLLRNRDVDLSSLRVAMNGGEPVRAETIESFESALGLSQVVTPSYGLGEATLGVANAAPGRPLRTLADGTVSCGPPLPGVEVQIVDEKGRTLPVDERGEILVRSPGLFTGYVNDPGATEEVLREGWLHTGDIGSLDSHGELYVGGRKRAMIKRAGRLVPSRLVETAAEECAGVRRSAAFGTTIDGAEEMVVVVEARAADVADKVVTESIVAAHVRATLGFPPARVVFVRHIPLTSNGKVRHSKLAEAFADGSLGG